METPSNILLGSAVWVEDPEEAWIDGEVSKFRDDGLEIICSNGKTVVVKESKVCPKDTEASPSGVDDMTKLAYLHEPGVLRNLKSRYDIDEIYTYTGNILIAVNPFRRLPHLYEDHMMEQYKGAKFGELSPHPYAVADAAYRRMINDKKRQAILVSGESGSGKTESMKTFIQYLAYIGGKDEADGRSVEQQVLESNSVLEAFGNAKIVRNNNSSRFGKFVEIQFDNNGKISGAAVRTYLLEKSRICQVSDPERNYHCFYMLCAAPPEDIERFKVGDPSSFHYLNQSNCFTVETINDAKEYIDTRRAMEIVGIDSEEQDAIFRVIAAILHLGNVEFSKRKDGDSSEIKDEKSQTHLKTAAELFMCDEKALEDSLCKHVIVTRGEKIVKNLDPAAAVISRDALAKVVYARLFDWLVVKINISIGQDPESELIIGVLDIYGFESFKTNSFEQFCINLTNEKLQQHFNQHVFKMEQAEYKNEEINWSFIDFIDNQDVLDLIEKKPGGIISLLDEACLVPRSTNATFAEKLYQTFKNHKRFNKPRLARTDFTIFHYAGDVTYQTDLFLDKNKDMVVSEHQYLMSAFECPFVSNLFPPLPGGSSKSSKFSSTGTKFKQQLQSLLEILNTTEPHYVRCVKPNNLLKPFIFENANVIQQLRCGGVLEAIRISCAGFPTRRTFLEFIDRFAILAPEVFEEECDEKTAARMLLEKIDLKGYQIGKSKVFLRAGQMAELDARRTEIQGRSAAIILRKVRSYLRRQWFILMRKSAVDIQCICRGEIARRRQDCTRKFDQELLSSSVTIQTGLRGMVARKKLEFRRETRAAIIVQSKWRMHLARSQYTIYRKAVIVTQSAWRARVAKLKQAACETGDPRDDNKKLEKQVEEELTWRLNLEKRMRENVDALINCVVQNNGFSQGKPVAAFTTYKCLLHWKSFEAERTSVFDRLIQMIGSAIENEESNGHLAYWLSNTSSLLFLLQHSLKAGSSGTSTPKKKPPPRTTLFGRMAQGFRSASSASLPAYEIEVVRQVEAKYPALLFKQQLTAYVEKIYGIIRDNVKKELTPVLTQCLQAPRTTKSGFLRASPRGPSLGAQWQSIIESLDSLLSVLKENHVPHILVQKMYTQIFSFINVQLFNSLLLRRECCSFTNGDYVKSGLAELEHWCTKATPEYAGHSSEELKHVRQAVGFLVIFQKFRISLDDIRNDLCPVLSVQQIYKICTQYWDDEFNTLSVSPSVLSSMRVLMTENNNDDVSDTFLLNDNSSIPFSVDDIASCLKEKEFTGVKPAAQLLKNQSFYFLQE